MPRAAPRLRPRAAGNDTTGRVGRAKVRLASPAAGPVACAAGEAVRRKGYKSLWLVVAWTVLCARVEAGEGASGSGGEEAGGGKAATQPAVRAGRPVIVVEPAVRRVERVRAYVRGWDDLTPEVREQLEHLFDVEVAYLRELAREDRALTVAARERLETLRRQMQEASEAGDHARVVELARQIGEIELPPRRPDFRPEFLERLEGLLNASQRERLRDYIAMLRREPTGGAWLRRHPQRLYSLVKEVGLSESQQARIEGLWEELGGREGAAEPDVGAGWFYDEVMLILTPEQRAAVFKRLGAYLRRAGEGVPATQPAERQ